MALRDWALFRYVVGQPSVFTIVERMSRGNSGQTSHTVDSSRERIAS